jgi:hypothetical protein
MYHAPELDPDPAQGYTTGSSGIAVISEQDGSLLESLLIQQNGYEETDKLELDLSAHAGKVVRIEVVDAFAGGWGWLAVDEIRIDDAIDLDIGVPGDVDDSGLTDRDDFDIISMNMGLSPASREQGNLGGGAGVDLLDFRNWKQNVGCFEAGEGMFECPGDQSLEANAAVPEPSACVLLGIGTVSALMLRGRRHC